MKIITVTLLFVSTLIFSQNTKLNNSISVEFGYGQLLKREWSINYRLGTKTDRLVPYYGLNYNVNYPIIKNKLLVQSGVGYKLFKTAIDNKNEYNEEIKLTYSNNSIELPLQLKYFYEDYLSFNAGVTNSMLLDKNNSSDFYSLMFKAGFDIKINDKLLIGTNFYRDITPTFTNELLSFEFMVQRFGINIIYNLNTKK